MDDPLYIWIFGLCMGRGNGTMTMLWHEEE